MTKSEKVTLYVRVWIETALHQEYLLSCMVTLYVRVWIETAETREALIALLSPST